MRPRRHPRRPPGLLLGLGALLAGLVFVCLQLARRAPVVAAAGSATTLDAVSTPAEPESAAASAAPPAPATDAGEARDAAIPGLDALALELERARFLPRVFADRLAAASAAVDLRALASALRAPPARDGELVALAALARERALELPAALRGRLGALAARDEGPLGLALESARTLVASGDEHELARWCSELEDPRSARAAEVARTALASVRDGRVAATLLERALEWGTDPRAGTLLSALQQACSAAGGLRSNPDAWRAAAPRLAELAGDERSAAGTRASALALCAHVDGPRAAELAAALLLDARSAPALVERAAQVLCARGTAAEVLRPALADPGLAAERRVRLAECVLAGPPDPEARAAALEVLRTGLEGTEGSARRRALHALARHGTSEDRERLVALAAEDTDPLARALARTALRREASEWP